ncbi:hypothetical protein ACH5RR_028146 [Cinchona calisaya]|uniref:RRM domain-containing protein n=1 Tax=Cinchona calisaya TaxID=153742 RepID=A0ABD2YMX5_9GENT
MNQIKVPKYFDSQGKKLYPSELKLSNPLTTIPSVNLEAFSVHQLHQILHNITTNPIPNLNKTNKEILELLWNVEKQEKQTIHNILQSFTRSQLLEILEEAAIVHSDILHTIRSVIDYNPSHRKIFVRSLGPKTTSETLHNFFSSEYGEVEEAEVIFDRATGNSKGYGFVTFKNVESFLLALKTPSKKIEAFVSFTSIYVNQDSLSRDDDQEKEKEIFKRKIRVENVPTEMSSETLLDFFEKYGEIEEGPRGFDMGTGKSRGFAYFVYKNEESAKAALAEKVKNVDGVKLVCKMVVKEREKNATSTRNNNGLDLVESFPLPLRVLVMPVLYYYNICYFRELVTYNCHENQLFMGDGGQGGQFGTLIQEPPSSTFGPVPCIAGGDVDSVASSSVK